MRIKHDTVTPGAVGGAPWLVRLHREVGKDVTDYGLSTSDEANRQRVSQRKKPLRNQGFNGGPSWVRTRDLMLIKHAL